MSMTDPIADLLARIRNAHRAGHRTVDVPASRLKLEIVRILAEEGYVDGHEHVSQSPRSLIRIQLRYGSDGKSGITGLHRVSRPGRRVYCQRGDVPRVLNGLGVTIVSTSKGVVSDRAARKLGVGGELLCSVW